MKTRLAELPYQPDGAVLFSSLSHMPWAVYLDSGHPGSSYGRYDILAADPYVTLTTRGMVTEIRQCGSSRSSGDDPFALLQELLHPHAAPCADLPFCGGALGYFAYDLARRLEKLPALAENAEDIPEMAVGIYDWAVVLDHQQRRAWLVGQGRDPRTEKLWPQLLARFGAPAMASTGDFRVLSAVTSNMDQAAYAWAFARVQGYIHAGDCYQVNLAQRFSARAEGDAWRAYLELRKISPAPFSAYLNTPVACILSASPERFLRVSNGRVETRPIKGTRPRDEDPVRDRSHAEALLGSLKDRAENLMIVDLLRNDLGKNCTVGSVRTDRLFALESFADVHHLVSTVSGTLAPGRDAVDLLRGCFPGGSITGAPKLRAMQIIETLEPQRRGVYCGAIGYLGFDGGMDTNIAIRTAVYSGGTIRFWAGGGIVADSEADKEYHETWDKAASMLQLMECCRVGS